MVEEKAEAATSFTNLSRCCLAMVKQILDISPKITSYMELHLGVRLSVE